MCAEAQIKKAPEKSGTSNAQNGKPFVKFFTSY